MIEAAKFGGLGRFKLKIGDMEEHVMRKELPFLSLFYASSGGHEG